jgi:hypothetical protein
MTEPTYLPIDTLASLSRSDFEQHYLARNRPVIVRQGVRDTHAARVWTPEWFAQTYPTLRVPVAIGPRRNIARVQYMQMRAFVREMAATRTHMYLRQYNIFHLLPELLQGLPDSPLHPRERQLVRNFWMGSNTLQPLHYDSHWRFVGTSNLFSQIYGRKKVILASPEQSPFLYERRGQQSDYHLSEVEIEAPDLDRFPLLRKATFWTGEVEGGDLLFVPRDYWHFMQAFGASISVSTWWHPHRVSDLVSRILALAGEPQRALELARAHAGACTRNDIEELGGMDDARDWLRHGVPEHLRDAMFALFDEEVRANIGLTDTKSVHS